MDIDLDKVINECGIEVGIDRITPIIAEKIRAYKNNRDEKTAQELTELLKDRENIYNFDKETIKKYIKLD